MASEARLDARLLVGTEDEVFVRQRFPVPAAAVQIQNPGCFFDETGIAGENPIPKLPRFNRGGSQDPTDRRSGDGSAELVADSLRQVGQRLTAQGSVRQGDEFASHRFDRSSFHWGKKPVCDRDRTDLRVRILRPPTAFATCER